MTPPPPSPLPSNPRTLTFVLLLFPRLLRGRVPCDRKVLVIADKCGDAYAAPLPNPSAALKHLLGHTAMTITAMVSLNDGRLLATADRAEHIRVSEV